MVYGLALHKIKNGDCTERKEICVGQSPFFCRNGARQNGQKQADKQCRCQSSFYAEALLSMNVQIYSSSVVILARTVLSKVSSSASLIM